MVPSPPSRRRRPAPATAYDAFISYSHAVDGRLAPALQAGLHRFAKPWYRARAVRVFRDETSLSANPALWPSIEGALRSARFFVLLASPEAAASKWVDREVAWWLANKSVDTLLVALTGGELVWDGDRRQFDWSRTTALPPALRAAPTDEPRWVDLRWAAHHQHLSMRDPRFRDCVADLAAPLHDRPKDELIGEDVRQHRRTLRLARGAVASLLVLALVASGAAVVAVRKQREASAQARLATSRQLAATATNSVDAEYDLALLLGVAALRAEDTPQARSSLFSALERNPQHVAFLRGAGGVTTQVRVSGDGSIVAAGDETGGVTIWGLPDGAERKKLRAPTPAAVESLALGAGLGELAVGTRAGDVAVLDPGSGAARDVHHFEHPVTAVALSPDGRLVAAGDGSGEVVVRPAAGGGPARRFPRTDDTEYPINRLVFSPDGRQLGVGSGLAWTATWDLATDRVVPTGGFGLGAHTALMELSEDLSDNVQAVGGGGHALILTVDGDVRATSPLPLPGPAESLAFSPDGGLVAAAGQGAVRLFDVEAGAPYPPAPVLTGYPGGVSSISFSGDRRWLAVASGEVVVVSDLRRSHRLGRVVAEPRDVCNACTETSAAISRDGRTLAWLDSGGFDAEPSVRLWDLDADRPLGSIPLEESTELAFRPDGKLATADPLTVWDLDGRRVTAPAGPAGDDDERVSTLAFTDAGEAVAVVGTFEGRGWTLLVRGADGRERFRSPSPTTRLAAHAVSPSGRFAVAGGDGAIRVLELATGRQTASLAVPAGEGVVENLAFDGGGRQLASVVGGTITVWDPDAGKPGLRLRWGKEGAVRFSPDGRFLAAGALDGSVTVWEVPGGRLLGTVQGQDPKGGTPDVVFTPDGSRMATVVAGGGLVLWDLRAERWVGEACAVVRRDLTDAEWEAHTGGLAPRDLCG